ncbi:MAG: hypothetical protein NC084_03215 [Bacteroides sp.]|nr:hypothetical protein [Eubacterium sp.]MCM1417583.1 hypothetical protein [Roseburia sp.]MCM1461706.1 hypothetical protein [Bacteroides sp.]
MIRAVTDEAALFAALDALPRDLFTGKLYALARGYGVNYPFLRFYFLGRSGVFARYYGAATFGGSADGEDPEEIAAFIEMSGLHELFLPESAYLAAFSSFPAERLNILKYSGKAAPLPSGEIRKNPPYEAVFAVLREGFPALSFEEWYPDACHNVRHGIAALYLLGESTAECAFADRGVALLTAVAAKKASRGTGRTLRLVRAVAAEYAGENDVYVVCRADLVGFYQRAGFIPSGNAYLIEKGNTRREPRLS